MTGRGLVGLGLRTLLGAALLTACGPRPGEGGAREPVRDRLGQRETYLRPDQDPTGLWRYDANDVVERFDSAGGRFRVHFTRAGKNAVSPLDNDADGIPDTVQLVARTYEEVATAYQDTMGFRAPLSDETLVGENGGDGRFDVYLLDFALSSDGNFAADACLSANETLCLGHIIQENDFAGYGYPSLTFAVRLLASHEYFHAVQAAYNLDTGSVVSEGTAVWASEAFDPANSDLRYQVGGYLENTERSLDVPLPGPVDPFSYGSALFFQFLSERHEPAIIRTLWEHLEVGMGLPGGLDDPASPVWIEQIDLILKANYQSSFAEAFVDFSRWNLLISGEADPSRSYAKGASYRRAKREALPFPVEKKALRLFHAGTRIYALQTAGRSPVEVVLVDNPDTAEDETEGLTLLGALRVGTEMSFFPDAEPGGVADGKITLDAAGASELLALVINTERAGPSKRPGLCAGTSEEVAACLDRLDPPPACAPPEDCGGGGGGDPAPKGCGCESGGSSSPALAFFVLLFALALATRKSPRLRPAG